MSKKKYRPRPTGRRHPDRERRIGGIDYGNTQPKPDRSAAPADPWATAYEPTTDEDSEGEPGCPPRS